MSIIRKFKTMDGNNAAAHVSYAFTEVAGIYPITPSSPMADFVDIWSTQGVENIFGSPVKVVEMQSEAGAAGTVHGSLGVGALTTTYTASQGLLLMIPNMYKIAGELLPCVFHVSARTLASHALNIFGDHSDVMACRQTGFAILGETNPQEVMDLAAVAHLATIESRVPFINFFDGFRTSHEIQKVAYWDYDDLKEMCDMDAVNEFRQRALNPEHPVMRGSHENGDVFFQHRETCNQYYDAVPSIVENCMAKVNEKLGTDYQLFNYYGHPEADRIIITMGSVVDVAEEVIDYLNAMGEKVGIIKVRLFRPFSQEHLLKAIPATAKKIAVLDRSKEPGALGEPLYMDVTTALSQGGVYDRTVIGGRYGLGSKDTPPSSLFAVYEELKKDNPKTVFTLGIQDDVTHLSLKEEDCSPNTAAAGTIECKFWGLGGDGTVGANKNSIKIIGDNTEQYVQAYFQYDSKKTGGVTISHLRFGDNPIKSPYYVNKADFVACHNPSYLIKGFPVAQDVKEGGNFLINSQWITNSETGEYIPKEERISRLEQYIPPETRQILAKNHINLYIIDAITLADKIGMGKRTNTILQSAFFALGNMLPPDDAIKYMKDAATKSYLKKGQEMVDRNHKAIEAGATAYVQIPVPDYWANAEVNSTITPCQGNQDLVKMVTEILEPVASMKGDTLPVSAFLPHVDGTFPQGASAYEKRGVAISVPVWDPDKCIQCNQCAYVCPHATIRPFALNEEEVAKAPTCAKMKKITGKADYQFALTVSPMDCMGCGVCVKTCPAKEKAITMVPLESQMEEQEVFDYMVREVSVKDDVASTNNVKGSQFLKPYLEFSGSCAGCAETTYARLITQLYGERMYISNATGCSSIWGGPAASSPYCQNQQGQGPTWANSLFEDNAEHGLGMYLGQEAIRNQIQKKLKTLKGDKFLEDAIASYLETADDGQANAIASKALIQALEKNDSPTAKAILKNKEFIHKKSVWIFGGDGWAYDIGFGGVDHVIASGEDINIFVFDTEVYSNTGGQASKASNIGQVAQFASSGKTVGKKSLGEIAMTYGYVYVAQIAMGANQAQTLKAIKEAEAYKGPSLIIAYSPCEMHSIQGGMSNSQNEMKKAVDCGYWNLYRFNPSLKEEGKNPFILDSKTPSGGYQEFLKSEARYSSLARSCPESAEKLFQKNEASAKERFLKLERLKELYQPTSPKES